MGLLPDWVPNPLHAYTDLYENLGTNLYKGISGVGQQEANKANQDSANSAQQFAQDSADKQMAFQERMSNTAYQRGMNDMETAGLNPMLAFSQGGASSPMGSSAGGQTAINQDVGSASVKNSTAVASTAMGGLQNAPQIAQMQAQTQASSAQAAQTQALTPALVAKAQSETLSNSANAMETAEKTKQYEPAREKLLKEIDNLMRSGRMQDLDSETKERLLNWQKMNPYLYRTKNTLDSLNPLKTLK